MSTDGGKLKFYGSWKNSLFLMIKCSLSPEAFHVYNNLLASLNRIFVKIQLFRSLKSNNRSPHSLLLIHRSRFTQQSSLVFHILLCINIFSHYHQDSMADEFVCLTYHCNSFFNYLIIFGVWCWCIQLKRCQLDIELFEFLIT